jgi:hypothetical protein
MLRRALANWFFREDDFMKVTVHDLCPVCRQAAYSTKWVGGVGQTILLVIDLAQTDEDLQRMDDDEFNNAVFLQLYQIKDKTGCDECWSKIRRSLPRHLGGD